MQAGSPFPSFHYEIGSFSSHYLPGYSHSKQPKTFLVFAFIFYVHCKNNTNITSFQLARTLMHELTTSIPKHAYNKHWKIIEENGI